MAVREATRSPPGRAATQSSPSAAAAGAAAFGPIDVKALLDQLAHEQEDKIKEAAQQAAQQAAQAVASECRRDIYKILGPIEQANSARFCALEIEQAEIKKRIGALEAAQSSSHSQLEQINHDLIRAKQDTPITQALDYEDFNRSVNPRVIRLRAAADLTIAQFKQVFAETMSNLGLTDDVDYKYDGLPLSRSASIEFTGADLVARLRTRKFFGTLKDHRGVWRQLQATSSTGEPTRVYADIDKNRCTLKTEMAIRRLSKFLSGEGLPGKIAGRKADGQILHDGVPLVRVTNVTVDELTLQWNLLLSHQLGINRTDVEARFAAILKPGGEISWG